MPILIRNGCRIAAVMVLSTLFAGPVNGQLLHRHRHTSHHHHDAMGHRIDDAGHHIDLQGHHTGAVGVYDNGAVAYPTTPNPAPNVRNGYWSNGLYYNSTPSPTVVISPPPTMIQNIPQAFPAVVAPQMALNRPPQNIVPGMAAPVGGVSAGKIYLLNPADSGGEIRYRLNDFDYTIKQGHSQIIDNDRPWVIQFGSGGSKGDLRYTLSPGAFKFMVTEGGWELVRAADPAAFPVTPNYVSPAPAAAPIPQPDGLVPPLLSRP